jgi:hypothetical protein
MCKGCLILHRTDNAIAGYTEDDEAEPCARLDLRHQGSPIDCLEWFGSCNYCGVH